MESVNWGIIGCGDVCERKGGPPLCVRTQVGAVGVMNVGWHETGTPETLTISGSSGTIRITDLKGGSLTLSGGVEERTETFAPLPATHWGLVENFVAHVAGGAPLAWDGVEGRKSTVILDLVEGLDPDGREVPVGYE
jgi:predicted dehydrogenase